MAAVALLDRVQRFLPDYRREEDDRVRVAVEVIAGEVDEVSRRLAVLDPEWELMARELIDREPTP